MAKFGKTVLFSGTEKVQAGQWVRTELGARGQYLGKTDSGAIATRRCIVAFPVHGVKKRYATIAISVRV